MTDPVLGSTIGKPITHTSDDGFALIEVLVAFVILAVALSGVYATLASSARIEAELALRDSAIADARSHLDRLIASPLTAGETSGRFVNGAAWRAVVTPLTRHADVPSVVLSPATITLTVRDGRNRVLVTLDTIALIPRAR